MKPWERYAKEETLVTEATPEVVRPWERYASSTPVAEVVPDKGKPWERYTEVVPEVVRPWEQYDIPTDIAKQERPTSFKPSGEGLTQTQRQEQVGVAPILSVVEPVTTLTTGAIAEPLAGIAGIAKTITSGADEGAKTVEAIREALTYKPRTVAGQEALQTVGETLAPVAKGMDLLDFSEEIFDITGSPLAASIFATLPTAAMELAGIKGAPAIRRLRKAAKKEKVLIKEAKKAVVDNTPNVEKLKGASQELYKSLDDSNIKVNIQPYNKFTTKLEQKLIKEGLDIDLTPKANNVLKRISAEKGQVHSLSDMTKLRKFAQNAAGTLDPSDARLGKIIISELDDFLGTSGEGIFKFPISEKLRGIGSERLVKEMVDMEHRHLTRTIDAARDLYGRAKRSELINEAFSNASLAAGGIESGLKSEFTRLLKNKKTKKLFKPHEVVAMNEVAKRPLGRNAARALGKLGFSEGNVLGLVVGGGALAAGGGLPSLAIPAIGEAAKRVASKMAKSSAKRAQDAVASGKDANKIIKKYFKAVPKAERSIDDLSDLLLSIDLEDAKGLIPDKTKLVKNAVEMAKGKKVLRLLEELKTTAPILAIPGAVASTQSQEDRLLRD